MARGLHRAGLVDVDVAALGADRPLVGPQSRSDEGQVGLGAAHQKVDLGLFIGTRIEDVPGGILTMVVGAVAGGLLEICLGEPPQDALVAAFRVIAGKVDHKIPPELIGSIITALSPAVNGISERTANRL